MADVGEITAFLTDRYDEEEAALEAIDDHSEPWRGQWVIKAGTLYTHNGWCLAVLHDPFKHPWNPRVLEHIVRYDPARAIAGLEAKRAIIDRVIPAIRADERLVEGEWGSGIPDLTGHENSGLLLCLLAAEFAWHPMFKPEWRID